jgi:FHA domain/Zinc-ribbon containing domain
MDAVVDGGADVRETGEFAAVGSLVCVECGYSISLEAGDELPRCPACGGDRFRRASMFESAAVSTDAISPATSPPTWLQQVREELGSSGHYVVYEEDSEPTVVELHDGWTRIGRSGSADICLDDATVSRRHALIVRTPEDELRALDDRSLNGLFVNGEQVEWAPLEDGDELEIGRYRLYVLQP